MGKAKNVSFIESYISFERAADNVTKRKGGGVSAYIDAIERQKPDASAQSTLKFLKRCRIVRNKLAHDVGALKSNSEISRSDTKKLRKLTSQISKGKDPLSRLIRKRARRAFSRRMAVILLAIAAIITKLHLQGEQSS